MKEHKQQLSDAKAARAGIFEQRPVIGATLRRYPPARSAAGLSASDAWLAGSAMALRLRAKIT
jgi:hypothetical protein